MEWRFVQQNPKYLVSDTGLVKSVMNGCILKPRVSNNGYLQMNLYFGGPKNYLLHRLVALAFIPNPNNLPQVNHEDGNKFNCAAYNLKWCTALENQAHAWATGLHGSHKGENNANAKLDLNMVNEIRTLYSSGGYTMRGLASLFGVSCSTISYIKNNKTWIF